MVRISDALTLDSWKQIWDFSSPDISNPSQVDAKASEELSRKAHNACASEFPETGGTAD